MTSEAAVQAQIRLQAAREGIMLWRNNSGALMDQTGRLVRFGLGNDSPAVNERYKSSDLIGIRPLLIQPHHLGTTVGQFLSIEVKPPGWTGDDRTEAQQAWIDHVRQWGGIGGFADSVGLAVSLWRS